MQIATPGLRRSAAAQQGLIASAQKGTHTASPTGYMIMHGVWVRTCTYSPLVRHLLSFLNYAAHVHALAQGISSGKDNRLNFNMRTSLRLGPVSINIVSTAACTNTEVVSASLQRHMHVVYETELESRCNRVLLAVIQASCKGMHAWHNSVVAVRAAIEVP